MARYIPTHSVLHKLVREQAEKSKGRSGDCDSTGGRGVHQCNGEARGMTECMSPVAGSDCRLPKPAAAAKVGLSFSKPSESRPIRHRLPRSRSPSSIRTCCLSRPRSCSADPAMSIKLRELIRAVRACKTAAEERATIAKECALIRTAFKEQGLCVCTRHLVGIAARPAHFLQSAMLVHASKFRIQLNGTLLDFLKQPPTAPCVIGMSPSCSTFTCSATRRISGRWSASS